MKKTTYLYYALFFLCLMVKNSFAQTDSIAVKTDSTTVVKNKYKKVTYIKTGIDISKPISSIINANNTWLEIHNETNYTPNINLILDLGAGTSKTNNQYVQYKSRNYFLRTGFDKLLFKPEYSEDKSNAYIGVHYGISACKRGSATYTIYDTLFGNRNGIIPSASYILHWLELSAGFTLELKKNIFIGWQIDGKALINNKKIEILAPNTIAGYGNGDKNPTYNYHFYILYGLHTKRK